MVRSTNLLHSRHPSIAYESADQLSGSKRDLAFSVVHLIDMARGAVEKSLNKQEA
ncbi:DUF6124 family protein [Pseudomonas quasicaspiana]|uniref:DUF6124 family protein n=1 Tax=Pseudomonas quasicaspiana TaxID=2829821 RepID=UPI003873B5A0